MTSSQFDLKNLEPLPLRFNKRSGSENLTFYGFQIFRLSGQACFSKSPNNQVFHILEWLKKKKKFG